MILPQAPLDWLVPLGPGRPVPVPTRRLRWGARAARLLDLGELGLPVSPGSVVTEHLAETVAEEGRLPDEFETELDGVLEDLERETGCRLGSARRPLLLDLSADGPPGSPTGFNCLGLNVETVAGLVRRLGNPRRAWEILFRLAADFAVRISGLPDDRLGLLVSRERAAAGLPEPVQLGTDNLRRLVFRTLDLTRLFAGSRFPEDPREQIRRAVAVLLEQDARSRVPAADRSRSLVLQAAVFGDGGTRSGAGVAYTRDPVSGLDTLHVDFLFNTSRAELRAAERVPCSGETLRRELPVAHGLLEQARARLEERFHDMQEIDFVVEDGELAIVDVRPGRRSAPAALKIACDLVRERRTDRRSALARLETVDVRHLRSDRVVVDEVVEPLVTGLPASGGVVCGILALGSDQALAYHRAGNAVVLVREDRNAGDLRGMAVAKGILITGGGRSSRTAVLARRLGIPCVAARSGLLVDARAACIHVSGRVLREGAEVTLDGHGGNLYAGRLAIAADATPDELSTVRRWIFEEQRDDHPLA